MQNPRSGKISVLLILLLAVVGLGAIGVFSFIGIKNGAVEKDETVEQKFGDLQASYQRRFDLIPNLVKTVQAAADFEKETLSAVTEARASVGRANIDAKSLLDDPAKMQQYMTAQQTLGGALQRLLMVTERYPDLKATRNFADLQNQLEGTENRINVARGDYNAAVKEFNTFVRKIPNAWLLSEEEYPRREPFSAPEVAQEAPQVDFGN